jgi:signal transduction histidine kinase
VIRGARLAFERWIPAVGLPQPGLALVLLLLDVALFTNWRLVWPGHRWDLLAAVVLYASTAAVAIGWRNRRPAAVLTFVALHATVAALALPYRPILPLFLAIYTAARQTTLRTLGLLLVPVTLALLAFSYNEAFIAERVTDDFDDLVASLFWMSVVIAVIAFVGHRVGRHGIELAVAQRRHEEAARRAVEDERRRLARELHDIIAHSVSVIVMQAAGAERIMATDPERAMMALAQIRRTGAATSGELRRLLTVQRDWDGDTGDGDGGEDVQQGAVHGLADLTDLVHSFEASGLAVDLREVGERHRLDTSVDHTAYRVVQEALTNVVKHAGPATDVSLNLRWGDDLVIDVTDSGARRSGAPVGERLSTGHGLIGMKERLRAVGGDLQAQRRSTGGFQVSATLPVSPATGDGKG